MSAVSEGELMKTEARRAESTRTPPLRVAQGPQGPTAEVVEKHYTTLAS